MFGERRSGLRAEGGRQVQKKNRCTTREEQIQAKSVKENGHKWDRDLEEVRQHVELLRFFPFHQVTWLHMLHATHRIDRCYEAVEWNLRFSP